MDKVLVKWIDSNYTYGWHDKGEIDYVLPECESIGYLILEDDEKVILTQTISSENLQMGTLSIPRQSVLEIKLLRIRGDLT